MAQREPPGKLEQVTRLSESNSRKNCSVITGSQDHDRREQQYFCAVFCLRTEVPRDNDDVCTKMLLLTKEHTLQRILDRVMTIYMSQWIRET